MGDFTHHERYTVTVDYAVPLEITIARLRQSQLTLAYESITTERFPVPDGRSGSIISHLELVRPRPGLNTVAAEAVMAQNGLSLCDPYQLVGLLAQHWGTLEKSAEDGLWIAAPTIAHPSRSRNIIWFVLFSKGRQLGLDLVEMEGEYTSGGWNYLGYRR